MKRLMMRLSLRDETLIKQICIVQKDDGAEIKEV